MSFLIDDVVDEIEGGHSIRLDKVASPHADLSFLKMDAGAPIKLSHSAVSRYEDKGRFLNVWLDSNAEWQVKAPFIQPSNEHVFIDCFGPNLTSKFNPGFVRNLAIAHAIGNMHCIGGSIVTYGSCLSDYNQATVKKYYAQNGEDVPETLNLEGIRFYQEPLSMAWRQDKLDDLARGILLIPHALGINLASYMPQSDIAPYIAERSYEGLLPGQADYIKDKQGNWSYFINDVAYYDCIASKFSKNIISITGPDQEAHAANVRAAFSEMCAPVNLQHVTHGLVSSDAAASEHLKAVYASSENPADPVERLALTAFLLSFDRTRPITLTMKSIGVGVRQFIDIAATAAQAVNDGCETYSSKQALQLYRLNRGWASSWKDMNPAAAVRACQIAFEELKGDPTPNGRAALARVGRSFDALVGPKCE